jgi:hypothetical protein
VATHNLLSESRSGFLLSDDERLLDMPKIFQWLSVESYWARGRGYGQRGTGSSASSLQRYAHEVYSRAGFEPLKNSERWMEIDQRPQREGH